MRMRRLIPVLAMVLLASPSAVRAQVGVLSPKQSELADEFEVRYDDMHRLVLNSFVRFQLSPACWTKMMDDAASPNGIEKVNCSINQIVEYLKR
jgi:hypothetical protein